MNPVICPVSDRSYETTTSRIAAATTATLLVAYAATGSTPVLALVVGDYVVRVADRGTPPIAWFADRVRRGLGLEARVANRGPKMFAWRVGFLMAVVAAGLVPVSGTAAAGAALALAAFNLLDGVGNLCVGCVVYSRIVLPLHLRSEV